MSPPPALVRLSTYPGPDADRLRADVATVGALTVPVLDLALQPFLTGSWVWPGPTGARAVAVRIGLGLPDIAPVRRELDQMMADQVWTEDDEELLAGGRFASGGRWGLLLARLTEDAATSALLVHAWSHAEPGLGLGLVAFAPGLDPRPDLATLLPEVEALRTDDVPRSARIGLARGSALMARAARSGIRSARAEDPEAEEATVLAGVLDQLAPDHRDRTLGVFGLAASLQPVWWRPEQVTTLIAAELAARLAGRQPTPTQPPTATSGTTSPGGAGTPPARTTRRRIRPEAVLVPVGVVVAVLLAIGLVLLLVP